MGALPWGLSAEVYSPHLCVAGQSQPQTDSAQQRPAGLGLPQSSSASFALGWAAPCRVWSVRRAWESRPRTFYLFLGLQSSHVSRVKSRSTLFARFSCSVCSAFSTARSARLFVALPCTCRYTRLDTCLHTCLHTCARTCLRAPKHFGSGTTPTFCTFGVQNRPKSTL